MLPVHLERGRPREAPRLSATATDEDVAHRLLGELDPAEGVSPAEQLAVLLDEHPELQELAEKLSDREAADLLHDWNGLWARESQKLPAGDWDTWAIIAGRGWGKTRTGAEAIRQWWKDGYRRFVLIGRTPTEIRDVMIEGESGILEVHPADERPKYEPSKMRLTWPNGAVANIRSAQEPDSIRGANAEKGWLDEPASYAHLREVVDNLNLALRLGDNPQAVLTTTPKPRQILREILAEPGTTITRGTTYENVQNLATRFLRRILSKYEGTRTGQQELHAMLLDEAEGALWNRARLELLRVLPTMVPPLARIVVALDPADGEEEGDEQAIAAVGLGLDHHYYVFWSEGDRTTPRKWLERAVYLRRHYQADRLIVEKNHGGAWIKGVLDTVAPEEPFKTVWAGVGKRTRAEPVAALYEQGRVHHVGVKVFGMNGQPVVTWRHLETLEDQMVNFRGLPGEVSPDRLDALVWAITELQKGGDAGIWDPDSHARDTAQGAPPPGPEDF